MRSRRVLVLFPLVWVACFSGSSGGNGNAQFDASFDASFDGTSPEAEPEASTPEASADVTAADAPAVDASAEADAGPEPITVVVAGALGYEPGVNVVFGDATGAVIGAPLPTDSHGRASTVQPGVAMATVLLGTPSAPSPYTVMGLVPGSLVPVVDLASIGNLPSTSAQVTAIPSTPNLGAVSTYQVTSGACVSTLQGLPFPLSLQSNSAWPCVGLASTATTVNPVLPLIVDALDTSGNILGFAATTTASPATPDDAGNIDVALGGSWSQSTTHQIVAVDNLPDAGVFAPQIAYSEIADGILDTLPSQAPPVDAGASAFAQVQTHVGFASAVQAEAQLLSTQSGLLATSLISTGPAPTKDGTVTLDASLLATAPFFQSAVTTSGPTVGQPIVQWSLASGNLGGATGLVTSFGWSQPLDGGQFLYGTWTLVSPGITGTSLTAPALPPSLAGYAPAAGTTVYENEIFAVYGQAALGSYASLLPVGTLFPFQQCSFNAPAIPPLPGAGTALIVQYSAGGSGC